MTRRLLEDEPWDAGDEDWRAEEDDESVAADVDDEEPTVPCPYCKRPIHEDSQRCPACGQYISREDAPAPRPPWWIVVGVLLSLYVVYRWIAG